MALTAATATCIIATAMAILPVANITAINSLDCMTHRRHPRLHPLRRRQLRS